MNILVVNIGSSSVKYGIYVDNNCLETGKIDVSSPKYSNIARLKAGQEKKVIPLPEGTDRLTALRQTIELLQGDYGTFDACGHRGVILGEAVTQSQVYDAEMRAYLESIAHKAPMHIPQLIKAMDYFTKILPDTKHVLVFDTQFHGEWEEKVYRYALPEKYDFRRCGYHGIAYESAWDQLTDKHPNLKSASGLMFQLGSGCSVCAVKEGKSVDTSFNTNPMEGLMMGTRPGNLDTSVALDILTTEFDGDIAKLMTMLNTEAGLKGVSGFSNDLRDVMESDDPKAKLAYEMFCFNAAKQAASMAISAGAVDFVSFTGGIGENSPEVREAILTYLKPLLRQDTIIEVVYADEEIVIASNVKKLLQSN